MATKAKKENRFINALYSNTGIAVFTVVVIFLTIYTIRTIFSAQSEARVVIEKAQLIPATRGE